MSTDPIALSPCTLLEWDSRFWGFAIARLNAPTLSASLLDEAAVWCVSHNVRCLYFRADGSCPRTLTLAAARGFRFVDVRVELSRVLSGQPSIEWGPRADVVRPATSDDLPEIRELAARAHRDTRFFKDEGFNTTRAGDLYRAWIDRDFAQHFVMACESGSNPGRPCGYVTCEHDAIAGEGRIGLIAVAPEEAGRGLGTHLVNAALGWFAAHDLRIVRVVTQATNVPAMRLYEAAGFRTSDVTLWFHKWFLGDDRS